MIEKIIALSLIMWVFIDWAKPVYEKLSFSRWITIGVSVALGIVQAILFKLDLLVALNIIDTTSIMGCIYAGLAISGGSALIYKMIEAVKNFGIANSDTSATLTTGYLKTDWDKPSTIATTTTNETEDIVSENEKGE